VEDRCRDPVRLGHYNLFGLPFRATRLAIFTL
jgi:hypothetical protein